MARIRNIKPDTFTDADVAELPPLHRWLMPALWCHADKDGRLEDKPRELKVKCLPFDDCDMDAMLWDLHRAGFLVRYEAGGKRYLQVPNFQTHQRFHRDEKPRGLPGPDGGTVLAPPQQGADTVPALTDVACQETGTVVSVVPAALISDVGCTDVGRRGTEPPAANPVAAPGGLAAPQSFLAGAIRGRRADDQPTNANETLRDAVERIWERYRGVRPKGVSDADLRAAFDKADGDARELLRVLANGLKRTRFPVLTKFPDLANHWDAYAATKEPEATNPNARATQADRVDANYSPPLTEDGDLDLMGVGS